MRSRGNVLMLVLFFLAANGIAYAVMASGVTQRIGDHRPAQIRLQALWLARSAVNAQISGTKTVPTQLGEAVVEVTKSKDGTRTATAKLAGTTAEVSRDGAGAWVERFTAAAR